MNRLCGWLVAVGSVCLSPGAHAATCGGGTADADAMVMVMMMVMVQHSLTRKGPRIEVLLLPSALAAFATWLVGMTCAANGIDQWLTSFRSKRHLYPVMRLGREALVRRWLCIPLSRLVEQIRQPSPTVLGQLGIPA